jgi:hypothetical protein
MTTPDANFIWSIADVLRGLQAKGVRSGHVRTAVRAVMRDSDNSRPMTTGYPRARR